MLTQEVAREKAENYFREGLYCSEAVFLIANEHLDYPLPEHMMQIASGFGVGMGKSGCACGALTGGVMALGLKFGRKKAGEDISPMFAAAQELHARFLKRRETACCRVLINKFEFSSPAHLEQCRMITGEVAADVIDLLTDK